MGPPIISVPSDANKDINSRDESLALIGYQWAVVRLYRNHSSATSARKKWEDAHKRDYEFIVRGNEIWARKKM